jgi:hypothetical protein
VCARAREEKTLLFWWSVRVASKPKEGEKLKQKEGEKFKKQKEGEKLKQKEGEKFLLFSSQHRTSEKATNSNEPSSRRRGFRE